MATETVTAPDNRPASLFASRLAFGAAGFVELNRRLSPAKLANTPANGLYLSEWLDANAPGAIAQAQTVGGLVDLWERAIKATVHDNRLTWDVKPKALVGPNRPEKQVPAAESEKRFADWQKESEQRTKAANEQAAAEKRIVALIAAFAPARQNRLDYTIQEKTNAKHRGWFETAKASGKDLLKVEAEIRADQQNIYNEIERSSWKM